MGYLYAFITGAIICGIAQVLVDKTKMSPGKILVTYVVAGVILTAVGIYEPIVQFGGAGATVPLLGFGYAMAKGVEEAVATSGLIGAFTGGFAATAGGIAAAVFFSLIAALVFKPREK